MSAIITQNTKHLFQSQFQADADSAANKYYIALGKSEDWNDSDAAPNPVITEREERDFRLSMQSAKLAANYSFVIPRVNWSSGTVFGEYDDTDLSHPSVPYYAMIDNNQVYVCVRQSRGANGTANPSTVAPSGTGNRPFATSDGYAWKFLYTVGVVDNTNFTSANFLPVKKVRLLDTDGSGNITSTSTDVQQIAIQDSSTTSPICGIDITDGGAGYSSAPTVAIIGNGYGAVASATIAGGAVVKIEIDDDSASGIQGIKMGLNYDYAHVVMSGGGSPTTVAKARTRIGPKAGFGADPRKDLRAKALMFNIQPAGDEDGEFHIGTSFRQIGLLKNPLDSAGAAYTQTSGNALRRLKLHQKTANFTKGSVMTGGTSGATAIVGDTDSAEIWYHQNETTLFSPFQAAEAVTDAAGGIGITDSASGVGGFTNSGSIDPFSGELLYIENRAKVVRSADQTEDIKVIVEI